VSWLRWLVTGLSLLRPGFTRGSVHVGFVVDEVTLGQGFLHVLKFFPLSTIPLWLSILIYRGGWTIGPLVAWVLRHSLTQSTWSSSWRWLHAKGKSTNHKVPYYVIYSSVPRPFLPMAHPTLTMSHEGTPQNFALWKGGTKQYVAIKMPIPYVNP
jgi:hypothetical protein